MRQQPQILKTGGRQKPEFHRRIVLPKLREAIFTGYFKPGEPISRARINELFRSSIFTKATVAEPGRIAIREALIVLENEGLVHIVPHVGTLVRVLSTGEKEEIQNVRRVLEEHVAVTLAAMPSVSLGGVSEINSRMRRIAEKRNRHDNDILKFAELDDQFHRSLAEAAGYPTTIARFLADLRKRLRLVVLPSAESFAGDTVSEHGEILSAIRGGDKAKVQRAVAKHLQCAMRRWDSRVG